MNDINIKLHTEILDVTFPIIFTYVNFSDTACKF